MFLGNACSFCLLHIRRLARNFVYEYGLIRGGKNIEYIITIVFCEIFTQCIERKFFIISQISFVGEKSSNTGCPSAYVSVLYDLYHYHCVLHGQHFCWFCHCHISKSMQIIFIKLHNLILKILFWCEEYHESQ